VSDTRAFQTATGWRARVSVEDGIAHLYNWLREQSAYTEHATAGAHAA